MIGKKNDNGKLRYDLLPVEIIEKVVEVLTLGAVEYGDNNWKAVSNAKERYYAAAMRHIVEWRKGNKLDEKYSTEHLAHAVCNLIFLMYFDNED